MQLPENCMILKESWGQGGQGPRAPLDPLLLLGVCGPETVYSAERRNAQNEMNCCSVDDKIPAQLDPCPEH